MKIEDIEPTLKRFGWTVECQSPLEIRHEDGSFATGLAAKIVIDDVLAENRDAFEHLQENISEAISFFEEDTGKTIGCFLLVFNPQVDENQLLELSPTEYEFIPSDAQILAASTPEVITRMRYFDEKDD